MQKPLVSIVILNMNGKQFLDRCLNSIKKMNFNHKYEIIMVDNGSKDGSQDYIKKNFPYVKLIEKKFNVGYAEGNNIGYRASKGDYIVFLNNDTEVTKNWLVNMLKVAQSDDKIGFCTPKQLMADKKTILYCDSAINYLGFSYLPNMYSKNNNEIEARETTFASGAALLVKRSLIEKIGLFDKDYIIYHEDVDLSWRAKLVGYKAMYVPTSVIYHYYTPKRNPKKMYLLEKNRLMTVFKNYSFKTIILIFPMFLLFELLVGLYSILRGWFTLKIKSYIYVLFNIRSIIKKRVKVQKLRVVKDKDILKNFTYEIFFSEESENINKIASYILKAYWIIIKNFI
jgi:hypothetical protein